MAKALSNRKRAFADVVSIEAWTGDFTKGTEVSLHADVVFGTARVGGESEAPVRFRLSVKRAEVVLVVSELEPVKVDPKTIFRGTPEPEGKATSTKEHSTLAHAKGDVGATASADALEVKANVGAGAAKNFSSTKKVEFESLVRSMHVKQSINSDGCYRWEIRSNDGNALDGRPWPPAEPNGHLIDQRPSDSKSVAPTVYLEVRCRREDLLIEDLELKDETLWQQLKARTGSKNRIAAAVSFIRDQLLEEGLHVTNIEDAFGQLTLGSAIAHES